MELAIKSFRRDELCCMKLRGLYEGRGFRRVHVNKFEEYALYVENKNFLESESIITFMDLSGKLLALKPDITLSVVRGIPKKELPVLEKVYYVDEVYRLSRENREYQVHNQIGVEMIGRKDSFSNLEVIDLALASLSVISASFVLDISHLGFVSGLLEPMNLPHTAQRHALSAIHRKSPHDVTLVLDAANVNEQDKNRVMSLCEIHGDFLDALEKAKPLIQNDQMLEAYDELELIGSVCARNGFAKSMRLDFSVVEDLNYYNGLIFLGYIEGLPKAVLTGGRYDSLMNKMGKKNGAVGFGVTLDALNTYFKSGKLFDFDVLVTYPADCDYIALFDASKQLSEQGHSVRLESEDSCLSSAGFSWAKHYRFIQNELKEAGSC